LNYQKALEDATKDEEEYAEKNLFATNQALLDYQKALEDATKDE
jgi:hypothetical protein